MQLRWFPQSPSFSGRWTFFLLDKYLARRSRKAKGELDWFEEGTILVRTIPHGQSVPCVTNVPLWKNLVVITKRPYDIYDLSYLLRS